jgi:hypothetical protein
VLMRRAARRAAPVWAGVQPCLSHRNGGGCAPLLNPVRASSVLAGRPSGRDFLGGVAIERCAQLLHAVAITHGDPLMALGMWPRGASCRAKQAQQGAAWRCPPLGSTGP